MKKASLISLICLILTSCGTVAPIEKININDWETYNHKTSYHVKHIEKEKIYLTLKYGSYTFFDKSSEIIPTAKTVFENVADQLAKKNGYSVSEYEKNDFYESVAYNGITGISTALVSNHVYFSNLPKNTSIEPGTLSDKLKQLKDAYDAGLINDEEYKNAKSKLL